MADLDDTTQALLPSNALHFENELLVAYEEQKDTTYLDDGNRAALIQRFWFAVRDHARDGDGTVSLQDMEDIINAVVAGRLPRPRL